MPATLLCVQQDRDRGNLYAEALSAEGYEVLRAQDGRGALEIVSRHRPGLVLMDVTLARQDGFEVLAEMRMRRESKTLPVLLLSEGDVSVEFASRAKKLGAIGIQSAPVEADCLIETVAAQVGAPEDKPIELTEAVGEGNLREIPVPELLRGLHVDALDGVLLLDHGKKKKAIELRRGWPVSVKSNLLSECFGSYLISHGRCTKSELDESIKRMRTGEGLQGEILVAMDVLDESAVVEALQDHALEKFLEIFSWRDGRFKVRAGAHVQRGSRVAIDGHPSKLIVEGIRRHFPIKQIDRYLEGRREAFLVPNSNQHDHLAAVGLSGDEVLWLRKFDRPMAFAEVLDSPEAIRRVAFGLISIEVLAVDDYTDANELSDRPRARTEPASTSPRVDPVQGATSCGESEAELRTELASLGNDMQGKDHYGVLGVSSTSPDEEIHVAYLALEKRVHPDRFQAASNSIRQLAARICERVEKAYASIATAEDRQNYAAELSRDRRPSTVEDEGRRALQAETEYQRGEQLVAKRDYEGALLCFGRAIENFPSEGEYRSHYGWCLYLCHPDNEVMLGEALEHCREGVKLAKDREKPYLLLGRLYKAMGRVVAAKKMFTRAVEIRPQCVEAMRELRIMSMRRDKDKGVLKRIFRR